MIDWLYADLEELIDMDYDASEGGQEE